MISPNQSLNWTLCADAPRARQLYRSLEREDMHPLIEHAKATVLGWPSEEPRDLAIAVASLCKHILDDCGLPEDGSGWLRLRKALDVARGDSIAASVGAWDDLCRLGEFDISDNDAYVKLGIVTWTV